MTAWQLFRHLNIFNHHPTERHPVYQREAERAIDWTRLTERIVHTLSGVIPAFAAAYLLAGLLNSPLQSYLDIVLVAGMVGFVLLPSLAPWSLAFGLLIGPAVARERVRGTWAVLRVIPGGVEPVLLAKLRAALWPLRHPLHIIRHIWLVMAFPVGLGVMQGFSALLGISQPGTIPTVMQFCASGGLLAGALFGLLAAGMALYFIDRVHQLIAMALAALAVSTGARSTRMALVGGVTAALLAWIAETAGAALLVLALPGDRVTSDMNALGLLVLGPVGGYVIDLQPIPALVAAAITLAAREIAIQALWRWSLWAARQDPRV